MVTRQTLRGKPTVAFAATAALGAYALRTYLNPPLNAETREAPKAFNGSFGFTSLRLHSIEPVNHNVKRLRFELPYQDAVSGLGLTCTWSRI